VCFALNSVLTPSNRSTMCTYIYYIRDYLEGDIETCSLGAETGSSLPDFVSKRGTRSLQGLIYQLYCKMLRAG
jgi:hypothetical protein